MLRACHRGLHERNEEVAVERYDLYRYDATRAPLIVT